MNNLENSFNLFTKIESSTYNNQLNPCMESLRGYGGYPQQSWLGSGEWPRLFICDKVPRVFLVEILYERNCLDLSSWLLFSTFRHLYDLLLTSTVNSLMKGLSLQTMLSADCPAQSIKEDYSAVCCVSCSYTPQCFAGWASPVEMICGWHPSTVTLGLCTQQPLHLAQETQGRMQANASKFSRKGKNYHTLSNGGTSFIHNHSGKWKIHSISEWVRTVNICLNWTDWNELFEVPSLAFIHYYFHLSLHT